VPTFNASLPERTIGGQIGAVSGRWRQHRRPALASLRWRREMSATHGGCRAVDRAVRNSAPHCVARWLNTQPEVAQAVRDAAPTRDRGLALEEWRRRRLSEAADAQAKLVFDDGYADMLAAPSARVTLVH